MTITQNTKLSELTVGEFQSLIREELCRNGETNRAFGIKGLADLFGVSYSQAKSIKASGVIDRAITQRGRTIIIDKAKALELFKTR